jgi:hypothetical protein
MEAAGQRVCPGLFMPTLPKKICFVFPGIDR